jgi:hypothetical protein
VSLVTAILGFAALYGFTVPDGTAEQIVSAMYAKDWGVLLSVLAINILNPFIRFLKEIKDIEPAEG